MLLLKRESSKITGLKGRAGLGYRSFVIAHLILLSDLCKELKQCI